MTGDAVERRIRWRIRRGMRELDLMLRSFVDATGARMSPEDRATLASLLETEDDILWDWLNGQDRPEEPEFREMVDAIRRYSFD